MNPVACRRDQLRAVKAIIVSVYGFPAGATHVAHDESIDLLTIRRLQPDDPWPRRRDAPPGASVELLERFDRIDVVSEPTHGQSSFFKGYDTMVVQLTRKVGGAPSAVAAAEASAA